MTYKVRTVRESGTITYHCQTPRTALDKVQEFIQAKYRDISIETSDEATIPLALLAQMVSDDASRDYA